MKDKLEIYEAAIKKRQAIVKQLATEFNAIHVPFKELFNAALKKAPADYWIWDGIHPMPAGHELMVLKWMKQVNKKIKIIKSG